MQKAGAMSTRNGWKSLLAVLMMTLVMTFSVCAQDNAAAPAAGDAPTSAAGGATPEDAAAAGAPDTAKPTGQEAAPSPELAAPLTELKLDTGDTAWVLASAAFVLLMTPGLAFFYGGLVRSKNMLNTLLMSFGAMAMMPIIWMIAAYSIAFGDGGSANAYWGGLQFVGLNGVDATTAHSLASTIPHQAFMVFQMMFFIITPALISGSLVERMKFSTYMVFIAAWGLLVYAPVCHWVWGGGFIGADIGALDFAGGAVVHVNAGFAALAGALALGPRKGYNESSMRPHNLPLCLLGVGMLWFGWYGFNAGSAVGAGSLAVVAFVNTTIAPLPRCSLDDDRSDHSQGNDGSGCRHGCCRPVWSASHRLAASSHRWARCWWAPSHPAVCYVMANIRAKGPGRRFARRLCRARRGRLLRRRSDRIVLLGHSGRCRNRRIGCQPVAVAGGMGQVVKQIMGTGIVAIYSFVVSFILFKVLQAVMGLRATTSRSSAVSTSACTAKKPTPNRGLIEAV
jgi:Amt family ammonium transporter